MKMKVALLAGVTLAIGVTLAPSAHADYPWTAQQDGDYVALLAAGHIYNNLGPSATAAIGEAIANDISSCRRDPLQERNALYALLPSSFSPSDANLMVNAATEAYLGFGPGDLMPGCGGGRLA